MIGRGPVAEEHLERWEERRRNLFYTSFSPGSCPISTVDRCHPAAPLWLWEVVWAWVSTLPPPASAACTCRSRGLAWEHLFLQGSSQASRHELIRAVDARKGGTEGGSRQGCLAEGTARPQESGRAPPPPLRRICRLWPLLSCGGSDKIGQQRVNWGGGGDGQVPWAAVQGPGC